MKKGFLTMAVWTAILLYLPLHSMAQQPRAWTWGKPNKPPANKTTGRTEEIYISLLAGDGPALTEAQVREFLEKTMVERHRKTPKSVLNESLYKRMEHVEEKAAAEEAIKKKDITKLNITPFLELEEGDSVVIKPFLGKDAAADEADVFVIGKKEETDGGGEQGSKKVVVNCVPCYVNEEMTKLYEMVKDAAVKEVKVPAPAQKEDCENCLTDTKMLYYDFSCKQFYKKTAKGEKYFYELGNKDLLAGERVQLTVENVNRYIYRVDIKGTNVHYQSDIPPLLNELFLGGDSARLLPGLIGNIAKAAGTSLAGSGSVSKQDSCFVSEMACRYEIYKRTWFAFDSLYTSLKALRLSAYSICGKFPCCTQDGEDMIKSYTRMLHVLSFARVKLAELQAVIPADKTSDSVAAFLRTSLPSEADITKLYLFVQNIRARNNSYVSPPMYVTGNRFELELKITPLDSVAKQLAQPVVQPYDADSGYYDFAVRWKPFVSFSSGSFIAVSRHMQNTVYAWQPVIAADGTVDGSRYVLAQSGHSKKPMGLAAFVNAEVKACRWFGFGLSAGVGVTIDSNPSLAYLGGVSLFLGDMHQLALTAGLAGMQVNRLQTHLQSFADSRTIFATGTRPAIEYYKEMKTGLFVSVSYTPFKYTRRPLKEEKD